MRQLSEGLKLSAALMLLCGVTGCMKVAQPSEDESAATAQKAKTKSTGQDTSVIESTTLEGVDSDTQISAAEDTGEQDTGEADTGVQDTGVQDTGDTQSTDVPDVIETDTQTPPASLTCTIEMTDETEASISDAGVLEVVGEVKKTTILFIFDKSGSMGSYWGGESRWSAAAGALQDAVAKAHEFLGEKLRIGALMFPLVGECEVLPIDSESQIDFMSTESFTAAWSQSASINGPGGSTPLEEALNAANTALIRECDAGRMDHLYKVIILTDGEPNCGIDESLASEILTRLPAQWTEHGIKTFVFGLPGSVSAEDLLNNIAEAGGTEEYFAPYQETPDGGVEDRSPDDVGDDIAIVTI